MGTRATLVSFILVVAIGCNGGSGPSTKIDTGSNDVVIDGSGDVCTPSCEGKECGDDGCEGICGACNGMLEQCSDIGQCEPFPCDSTLDCPGTLVCNQDTGECVVCVGDEDCLPGEICGADFGCHEQIPCVSDKDCKDEGLVCDKEAGLCVECLSPADCDDDEYCFENYCLEDVCVAGESHCDGQDVLLCNDEGSVEDISETCGEAQHCEDGACYDHVCPPGEVYCDGNDLNTCDDIGKEILSTIDCEDDDLFCHDGACIDQECEPNTGWCTDDFIAAACAEDGMSSTLAPCPAEFYCEDGTCHQGFCEPGSVICDGDVYKVCDSKGSAIQFEEDCSENEQFCFNGACIDTECPPGVDFCADAVTKAYCADSGESFTTEACPAQHYCDMAGGTAQCLSWVCTPGAAFCEDNTAKVCNTTGSAVANEVPCGATICVGGVCKPVVCTADTSFCDGNTVMECDMTGTTLQEVETCGEGQFCGEDANAAACADQECEPNAKTCQGTKVMECDDVGAALEEFKDCADEDNVCLEGACCTPDCDSKNCGDDGCGGSCGDCGDECTEGDICEAGVCLPGEFICVEDCDNEVDDDQDGLVDCDDDDCFEADVCNILTGETCGDALLLTDAPLTADAAGTEIVVSDTTAGLLDDVAGSCIADLVNTPDLVYTFELVDLLIMGASFDFEGYKWPALTLFEADCMAENELSCVTAKSGAAVITQALPAGVYFLVLDASYNNDAGPFTLTVTFDAVPDTEVDCANGVDDDLNGLIDCNDEACGDEIHCVGYDGDNCNKPFMVNQGLPITAELYGETITIEGTTDGLQDFYGACVLGAVDSPDAVYSLVVQDPVVVHATHDFDDYLWPALYAMNGDCDPAMLLGCDTATTGAAELDLALPAGSYFFVVDASYAGDAGAFTFELTFTAPP